MSACFCFSSVVLAARVTSTSVKMQSSPMEAKRFTVLSSCFWLNVLEVFRWHCSPTPSMGTPLSLSLRARLKSAVALAVWLNSQS